MKQLILAAVAATFVFASAAQAATSTTDQTTTTTTTTMTEADCAKAMADCGTDQACKDALVKEHACKAQG